MVSMAMAVLPIWRSLALSAAYGHHGVDSFQTRLERLVNGLAVDNAGSLALKREADKVAGHGAAAVDRFAENINNTAEQAFANGNGGDFACAAHCHVLGHFVDLVEQNDADIAFLKVERNAFYAVFELYKFVGADVVEAVDVGHAVAYFKNSSHFLESDFAVYVFELLF